ncbi:GNAT family N-acetyltransferase [Brucella intermedia]|uniref:GNAT family N-acetyltransferase n=1 Tax=Brucella intermedia TaxID=94625 RepID=UPI002361CA91|nr:GNAT family N-acetyltransferase [Brucella intermedia]
METLYETEDNDGEIRKILLQLLIENNTNKVGTAAIDRSIIYLKDADEGKVSGGIWAEALFDWMYIEIVYVPENKRGQGIGSQLVARVEQIAKSKGCVGVWLETFQFQAPEFYMKKGYEIFATLKDYPKGYTRFFLKKVF